MPSETTTQIAAPSPDQPDQPDSPARENSPVAYGLGTFGLTSTGLALAGYFLFYYVDVLGLTVAMAALKVCREMILARLVDRSLERTGRRQEGVYYSLSRLFGQLSKILEALALVLLGVFFGYVSGEDPGPNPETAFRFLMSVLPFICMVAAWLLARSLNLEDDRDNAQA